ncbi:MAG: response regulator transcription factor [Sphingobacteriales bacterium]|nr:MAG: response regulator transcription factor [Sphingobacteriales bacterium]
MPHTISIAIADDHMLFRKGVVEIVSGFEGMRIVAEAGDGHELIALLTDRKDPPDLCLLDIRMPRMNGYDVLPVLKQNWPSIRVLVVSMYDHDYSVLSMLRMGASGFINKDISPEELEHAIRTAHQTGYYHSDIQPDMMAGIIYQHKKNKAHLSKRELEFLHYCCSEMNYETIAQKLNISVRTVDGYRESLFRKLNIHTRAGLVVFAMQSGLLSDSVSTH